MALFGAFSYAQSVSSSGLGNAQNQQTTTIDFGLAILRASVDPVNNAVDLVAARNGTNYHDNVLWIENDSISNSGQTGNAAFNFHDSDIRYSRGAFGYSVRNSTQHGYFPNTLYAEIGNIAPPSDPDDTSFAVISTHASLATNFPGTSYKAFEVRGDTGVINFRDHTGTIGFTWNESDHSLSNVGTINGGVSCSGTPTSSFASVGGIVIHC